jgi:hypothetical protein
MLEFENYKELKKAIKESKEEKVPTLSVFQSFWRMFLFLLFYALIVIVVTLLMYRILDKSARIVRVPSVINKTFLDAYQELKKINLNVHVQIQDYDNVPEGRVVAQSIPPNSQVKERRKIILSVASGNKVKISSMTNEGDTITERSIFISVPIPSDLSDFNATSDQVTVKIYLTDEGEHRNSLVYNQKMKAGETVRFQLRVTGKVSQKTYLNGVLYQEKEME